MINSKEFFNILKKNNVVTNFLDGVKEFHFFIKKLGPEDIKILKNEYPKLFNWTAVEDSLEELIYITFVKPYKKKDNFS